MRLGRQKYGARIMHNKCVKLMPFGTIYASVRAQKLLRAWVHTKAHVELYFSLRMQSLKGLAPALLVLPVAPSQKVGGGQAIEVLHVKVRC